MKAKSLAKGNTEVVAKEVQVKYEEKYGLTVFETRKEKDPIKALYAIKEWLPRDVRPSKDEFMERFWDTVGED
tara:strand:+ start:296 stop:514 length:219 start_codon:yes stop_codon:yes gene_type:complete